MCVMIVKLLFLKWSLMIPQKYDFFFFLIGKGRNILERKRSQASSPGTYIGSIQREPEKTKQKEG